MPISRAPLHLAACALALSLSVHAALGQSATTDPVGFISDTIPAHSDAALTAPLTRPPVFQGVIASIAGSTITVSGTPNWQATAPKQFQRVAGSQPNTYYVQIGNGTKAGMYATISDNGTNSITVTLNGGDSLAGIATEASAGAGNGSKVSIFPFWTPATLFPANWPAGVEVLMFDQDSVGINLSASQVLLYSGTSWQDEITFGDASDMLIHPGESFVVRNDTANPIDRTVLGNVPMIHHRSLISTLAPNVEQDSRIAFNSPAPQGIATVGLGFSPGDQLLVFDNSIPGLNKSASQIILYTGTGWQDQVTFQDVTNTFSLQPGKGYVYRKAPTPSAQDFVWQAAQSYNP